METIDVKDVEQAKTARSEILSVAAVLLSEITDPGAAEFEIVLDQSVKLYRGASARIKLRPAQPKPEVSAAA